MSGIKVNMAKSEIYQVGKVSSLPLLANILGCKIGSLVSSYLSLPLGAKFKSKVWDPVMEKISRRLESEKLESPFPLEK